MEFGEKNFKAQKPKIKPRFILLWKKRRRGYTEDRMFVVDSGASMQMLSKRDLSSDIKDTLRRSRTPTTVLTATAEVQINEEEQFFVHGF